jgi:hypothetical protein
MTSLQRLRELECQASKGPWTRQRDGFDTPFDVIGDYGFDVARNIIRATDAEFIAATRNAIPALLTIAEAAQDVVQDSDPETAAIRLAVLDAALAALTQDTQE